MDTHDLSALVSTAAAVLALASYLAIARAAGPGPGWVPAVPLAAFGAWTAYALVDDPLGLWAEHVGTPWETQIWLDLLIMAGLVWAAAQPRLRAVGAPRLPWLALIAATGSIGALTMVLWLHGAEQRRATAV